MQQLRRLLHHAYENVPYYRIIFDERGLKPKDIQTIDDLRKLPYLDKDTFKLHYNEIIARNVQSKRLCTVHTGGTTGKPLQFYQDPSEIEKEMAFVFHQWSRVGYKPGEPLVKLGGMSIGPNALTRNHPLYYDPPANILYLWPSISRKKEARYYLKKIKTFESRFLWGYPSAIASFAHLVRKCGLVVPFKLKAVLFASETVSNWQREISEEVFDCKVLDLYGQTEHVAIAAECEGSHAYHFVPQYGVTEIASGSREIIATGFLNYVNPFIRYRTGDITSFPALSNCKYCGRAYFPIVKKIEGRIADCIITPRETLISPSFIIDALHSDYKTIKSTQLVQTCIDRVVLRVTLYDKRNPSKSNKEVQILRQNLQNILGDDIQIKIEVVDKIERLKSGKFKWIISKV